MFKIYMKLAAAVAAGILIEKGVEAGGRKTVEIGKEVLDKRIRKVVKEDKED